MFKKILGALPLILAVMVIFVQFGFMPFIIKVIWSIMFVVAWFCRKFISENLISWLQSLNDPRLNHILWGATSNKMDENGKQTFERKPNETSLASIRLLVNLAIFAVFLGVPMLFFWLVSGIFGFFSGIWGACLTIFKDVTFQNGVGYFFFALLEIAATVAAIGVIVYVVKNCNRFTKKVRLSIIAGAFLLQRILTWFYLEYTSHDVIGEIFSWGVIAALVFVCIRYKDQISSFIGRFTNRFRRPSNNADPQPIVEGEVLETGDDESEFSDPF